MIVAMHKQIFSVYICSVELILSLTLDPSEIYCGFCQYFITLEEAVNLPKVAILALSK